MTALTFKQWSSAGYKIIKGQKAVGFREGEPLFNDHQVVKYQPRYYSNDCDYERDSEEGDMWGVSPWGNMD